MSYLTMEDLRKSSLTVAADNKAGPGDLSEPSPDPSEFPRSGLEGAHPSFSSLFFSGHDFKRDLTVKSQTGPVCPRR